MRILIATITAGGGHIQAAAALEEAWRASRPRDVVEKADLQTFFSRLHKKVYTDGYVQMVARAPELWGLLFKATDSPKLVRKMTALRRKFPPNSTLKFIRHVQQFKPDVVFCTHYLPVEILGKAREKWPGKPPFVVCVVTDFEAHALWMGEAVDLYCVAAEETRARLIARGADAENIIVTGIPISGKFSGATDAAAVRKRLGLRDDLPTLLVLGGGFGMGPVAEILGELDKMPQEFQTLVVAGFLTNCCVESTARTGYEKGFKVVALSDCAATVSDEAQHFTFEKNLPMFARILTHQQFLAEVGAG